MMRIYRFPDFISEKKRLSKINFIYSQGVCLNFENFEVLIDHRFNF